MNREVQGDFSNLKGSVYHLRYALRSLLTGHVGALWFYKGNDLLACSPPLVEEDGPFPTIALGGRRDESDIWVQLKFTEDHWSRSKLLSARENLLVNFITNAVWSERRHRRWKVQLVTPARVDQSKELPGFIKDPDRHSTLRKELEKVVNKARRNLIAEGISGEDLDEARLRGLAIEVLEQLAQTVPVRSETLVAEIEREIAYHYPDPLAVSRIANTLLGAMLTHAGAGPDHAITYDSAWLAGVSGRGIGTRSRLATDPISTCDESVKRSLPGRWREDWLVRRPHLAQALTQFLTAPQTAFVLLGGTGTGKSWAVADWASRELGGHVRLLLSGAELAKSTTLADVIRDKLRAVGPPDWSPQHFLDRVVAAAVPINRGPLVIFVDDVEVLAGASVSMRRILRNLVKDCRDVGAKLVLTAQTSIWEIYRLGRELDTIDVYAPLDQGQARASFGGEDDLPNDSKDDDEGADTDDENHPAKRVIEPDVSRGIESKAAPVRYSLVLDGYSDEELRDAVTRRLGIAADSPLLRSVAAPYFAQLRLPYFLDLFLSQHGDRAGAAIESEAPVDLDALLDHRIEDGLDCAASTIDAYLPELRVAFDALVEEIWQGRQTRELSSGEVAQFFDDRLQPGNGSAALAALQGEDLLSSRPPIRIAQPTVADRLFARRLIKELERGELDVNDLSPSTDGGAVAALLRAIIDPVPLAEQFLAADTNWARAVANGLMHARPDDVRILALLTILARANDTGRLGIEAAEAMGYLAARSRRALKWVARLYLSDGVSERTLAGRSLAVAANLVPLQVVAVVRLRLGQASRLGRRGMKERKRRDRLLKGALLPFFEVRDRTAASAALQLIDRYADLVGPGEAGLNHPFTEDADEVRAMASLALGEESLKPIRDQLCSSISVERFRAARSLRPVAIERPQLVAHAICAAIRAEDHPDVLTQLLWIAHSIVTVGPAALFDAVVANRAIEWSKSSRTAGVAIAILGDLAEAMPERVIKALPKNLDGLDPTARALHSEALAVAWWRLAERSPKAQTILTALTQPEVADVPNEFRAFACRGAVIAQLGKMCLSLEIGSETLGSHYAYLGLGSQVLFAWTSDFIHAHAMCLIEHPDLELLRDLLLDTVKAEDRAEINPLSRNLHNAAYLCANLCLEMLAVLGAVSPDPLARLDGIPRNRQALHVVRRLLELGRTEPEVVAFARAACDEHAIDGLTTGTAERERCLALMAALEPQGDAALAAHQMERRGLPGIGDGQAAVIARMADRDPGQFLTCLARSISAPNDVPTLYRLREFTTQWPQQVLAEVYARMFELVPIKESEARELCEMTLQALAALPATPERQEYEAVYRPIARCRDGQQFEIPVLPEPTSVIQQSHRWALSLLARHQEMATGQDGGWIDDAACDRRGWWETDFKLAGDTVHHSQDWVYAFPSVRLALAAIGRHYHKMDPLGRWMSDRMTISDLLQQWRPTLDTGSDRPEHRSRALKAFRERAVHNPRDERFWETYGLIALLAGELDEAERSLQRALALPWSAAITRSTALYNLACVHSRAQREDECRNALTRWDAMQPKQGQNLASDPDFKPMREKTWFADLARKYESW